MSRFSLPPLRAALGVTVALAYAVVIYAVVQGVPPLSLTIPLALVLAVLINVGTYFPNLEVFVDAVSRGPENARGVALTFDDGPHPEHTRAVLDLLDEYGAKATFFVLGVKGESNLELLAEIGRRGHDLAIHGYTHDRLFNMRNEKRIAHEVLETARLIEKTTGQKTRLFRPPLGFTSPRTTVVARELALDLIGYSARAYDGLDVTSGDRVAKRLAPGLVDGAIVLLHDAAERGDRKPASVEALRPILEIMKERGLPGVGLRAWLPMLEREGKLRKPAGGFANGVTA